MDSDSLRLNHIHSMASHELSDLETLTAVFVYLGLLLDLWLVGLWLVGYLSIRVSNRAIFRV